MDARRTARDWLANAQAQLLRGDLAAAQLTLDHASVEFPDSVELRRAQAGTCQRTGRVAEAESLLRGLLDANSGDVASAFTLADILKEQGRTAAAGSVLRACFADASRCRDAELAIRAIELLDDCGRKAEAAAIATFAIEASPDDARLHAYAGMLQIQLGEFERARQHYLFALAHDERAWEWHAPLGLSSAQCYQDGDDPDLALLRDGLQRGGLSDKARAELHFALAKAHDDLGDYRQAAPHFREGNGIAHRLTKWSRKAWRRAVEVRLASQAIVQQADPTPGFTPVFIVGMPRSGTTLLAESLSRHPKVRNRGELPWMAKFAGLPALAGDPDRGNLQEAAAAYAARSRQDDADDARWFIDKQPLNFRYVDLALAMFPDAKVIHCQRNERDTALSLWMQCFLEDVQGYSYDLGDIALVMHDCQRLMARWRERYSESICAIRYEDLVSDPHTILETLADWIGLPARPGASDASPAEPTSSISTASLWQVRQAVHTRSVGRWRHYATDLPELLRIEVQ